MKVNEERRAIVHRFELGGTTVYLIVTLNFPKSGEISVPEDILIYAEQVGTQSRGMCHILGLMCTLALQHKVPLDELCKLLENIRFEPAGFTGKKDIPSAKSIPDYVGRWLRHTFIETLNERNPNDSTTYNPLPTPEPAPWPEHPPLWPSGNWEDHEPEELAQYPRS